MPLWVPPSLYVPLRGSFVCGTQTAVDFTATVANTDVTGATVTLTSVYPNAKLTVVSFWDIDYTAVGTANLPVLGKLSVDGVLQGHTVICGPDPTGAAGTQRLTVGQVWPAVNIPTPKSFVVKGVVQAAGSGVNSAVVNTTHTKFSYELWDYPGQ